MAAGGMTRWVNHYAAGGMTRWFNHHAAGGMTRWVNHHAAGGMTRWVNHHAAGSKRPAKITAIFTDEFCLLYKFIVDFSHMETYLTGGI